MLILGLPRLVRFLWNHPCNRGRRIRALATLIMWQVWQRAVRRPLTLRLVGGLRMKCYPHSQAAALMLYCRMPEWQHMSFLCDYLRPGDTFVDVGANVGSYSLLAAATPAVTIQAFEPSTVAYRRLAENVDLNGLGARISFRRIAVGAQAGEATLSTGRDATNHVLRSGDVTPYEVVPMASLDQLVDPNTRRSVRLIKIDVEGFEEEVLRGATSLLAAAAPVLIVEANDAPAIRSLLEPLGYRACSYDPSDRKLVDIDWMDVRDNNVLAVRDRSAVMARLSNTTVSTGGSIDR